MASSGSFNTTSFEGRYLRFEWTEKKQDVATNKTTISWTLKGAGTGESGWYYAGNIKLVIDEKTVYTRGKDDRFKLYNGTEVASGDSFELTHTTDGTRSFSVSMQAGIYTYDVNCTGSKTFVLDTIARASQPSCITYPEHTQNVGNFGDTISIHMNRNSSAFTHTVRYAFGSVSGTCINADTGKATDKDVGTGFKWTIPKDLMNKIPANVKGSGTIYVDTYNGSTKIGTKSCGFTATVSDDREHDTDCFPRCSLSLEDVTGVDDIYGSPVKGLSRIKVTITNVNTAYSSPIDSYSITANGAKYSGETATTGALRTAGESNVTVSVTDERGRTGFARYDMTVKDYKAPAISYLAVHRCNENGVENDRGNYVKVTFSAAVHNIGGLNRNGAGYTLQYKKSSEAKYTTVTLALANQYAVDAYEYIFVADGASAYDIAVTAKDSHNSTTRNTSASTAFTLINFHASGTAMRFGGVAEEENTFQNDLEFCQSGNRYSFQPGAFSGEKGYTCMAEIAVNDLNVNAPIVFVLNRRDATCPMKLYVRFVSSSDTEDPYLDSFTYEGDNFLAYLVKTAAQVWRLYVDNTKGWSNPCVQDWFTTDNQMARIAVSFPNEQVAGTSPDVLKDKSVEATPAYHRATPVIPQSILDAFMPVGFILTLYSHADPNTMYPGTEWTRITNRFLWATTSGGTIGQTGGAAEHKLTASELPKLSGTVNFRAWGTGSPYLGATGIISTNGEIAQAENTFAMTTSSDGMRQMKIAFGGDAAHNNMPPYIQVSVWRRTA